MQMADSDCEDIDTTNVFDDLLPVQPRSIRKEIMTLEEYNFLPTEIKLLIDAGPGKSIVHLSSCGIS